MFCLIWYGLVTDFTGRIFKNLLTLPVLSILWPALQAGNYYAPCEEPDQLKILDELNRIFDQLQVKEDTQFI